VGTRGSGHCSEVEMRGESCEGSDGSEGGSEGACDCPGRLRAGKPVNAGSPWRRLHWSFEIWAAIQEQRQDRSIGDGADLKKKKEMAEKGIQGKMLLVQYHTKLRVLQAESKAQALLSFFWTAVSCTQPLEQGQASEKGGCG
jgi:hypothetical protein